MAESGGNSTTWHKAANNPVSIMSWKNGIRHLRKFHSLEENKKYFKKLWEEHYKVFPTIKEARRYTGNDRAEQWLENVKKYYE